MGRWEQAARYLGKPDARVEALMCRAFAALDSGVQPRVVSVEVDCTVQEEQTILSGHAMRSRNLAQLMKDSKRALVYVATLGVQADSLIARAQVTDMAYALVMQACAAAMVEETADEMLHKAEESLRPQGLHLTPSYAPGYGDLSIDENEALLRLTQAPKKIGVTRTAAGILAPTKSIAAMCGVTNAPCRPYAGKCARCSMTNCPYRKE